MEPIFALGPSRGAPKEPEEPILKHLGRLPFSTLIPDPKNRQKSSISRVPEPRKLHWRLDGSAIFTFSLISRPNPTIVDLGALLGAFWEPFGSHLASWAPLGAPWGVPGAPRGRFFGHLLFDSFFDSFFDALLAPKWLQNGGNNWRAFL